MSRKPAVANFSGTPAVLGGFFSGFGFRLLLISFLLASCSPGESLDQVQPDPVDVVSRVDSAEVRSVHKDGQACDPAFIALSKDPVKVMASSYLEIGASAILIGCRESLAMINEDAKLKLVDHLRETITANHYFLDRRRFELGFREQEVMQINSIIGKDLVDDVFIYGIHSTEFAPGRE